MRRMRVRLTMTGGTPTFAGTAPAHRLVLPPCGRTGTPYSAHRRTTADTCEVFEGWTSAAARTLERPRQSSVKGARSDSAVSTASAPSSASRAVINAVTLFISSSSISTGGLPDQERVSKSTASEKENREKKIALKCV